MDIPPFSSIIFPFIGISHCHIWGGYGPKMSQGSAQISMVDWDLWSLEIPISMLGRRQGGKTTQFCQRVLKVDLSPQLCLPFSGGLREPIAKPGVWQRSQVLCRSDWPILQWLQCQQRYDSSQLWCRQLLPGTQQRCESLHQRGPGIQWGARRKTRSSDHPTFHMRSTCESLKKHLIMVFTIDVLPIKHSSIYIYKCTRPCHPPHGMGPILRSSPSPPCGVVGVWYGMLGMYGVYGRSGMACLESMVCLVCMVGMVCMAWVVGIVWMVGMVCKSVGYGMFDMTVCMVCMVCMVTMMGMEYFLCKVGVVCMACMFAIVCMVGVRRCGNYISYVWYVWYVWKIW